MTVVIIMIKVLIVTRAMVIISIFIVIIEARGLVIVIKQTKP